MEDWVTIRNLKSKPGDISNREIAKLLGISHNTVKKALASEAGPSYSRKAVINPAIEPFKEYIEERYVNKQLLRSRVLNEIISKGYKGSESAFYRYTDKLQPKVKQTYQPYETAPGEQAQFDWSPYTIVINGTVTKVYVFAYILGFSRFRCYEASLSQTQGSTFDALENSIIETGGVPSRIQTDNATCFVIKASRENLEWNPRYLQLCGHFAMKPTRSLPGHPWSKGKVERPFDFLEEQFIKGNEFTSFEHFCKRLKEFQHDVNNRVHSTTKQTPVALFESERSSLGALPHNRFVTIKEEVRKVTADCLIAFQGSRYSVPYLFATKEVWLKIDKGQRLIVYSSQNTVIAEHTLSLEKGKVIINEAHYKNYSIERNSWTLLSQRFLDRFPDHGWFLEQLKTQKRINHSYHLTQVLDIANYYTNEDVIGAFSACREYNMYTSAFIQGYIQNHCRVKQIIPSPIDTAIVLPMETVNIKRPLSTYKFTSIQS